MEFAEAVRRRRMVRHFAPDAIDVNSPSLKRGWRSLDEFAHWDAW